MNPTMLQEWLGWRLGALVHVVLALGVSVHILLTKENHRSAVGWIAVAWLSPVLGSLAYIALGVNRVRRRAARLRAEEPERLAPLAPDDVAHEHEAVRPLASLARAVRSITGAPLVDGNQITPLLDGDEAYPAMLRAIEEARRSIAFMTFLWDGDGWGQRFVQAMGDARARGVEIRVLIDGVGNAAFSKPPVVRALRKAGVVVQRFLWGLDPRRTTLINLRNHRKLLVVDGIVAFTGGINIREGFVRGAGPEWQRDLHARVEGPVVRELMDVFAVDWAFTTGERLDGEPWFPPLQPVGSAAARVVPDGPDEDLDKARLTYLSAIGAARRRIWIVTPYFLPEEDLAYALASASRRGIEVRVLFPLPSNHRTVDGCLRAEATFLLENNVQLLHAPGGFDHSKLMLVDDTWACIGSSNWDPRSLRLNFELLLEVYDAEVVAALERAYGPRFDAAESLTLEQLKDRSVPRKLTDAFFRLFKPYL